MQILSVMDLVEYLYWFALKCVYYITSVPQQPHRCQPAGMLTLLAVSLHHLQFEDSTLVNHMIICWGYLLWWLCCELWPAITQCSSESHKWHLSDVLMPGTVKVPECQTSYTVSTYWTLGRLPKQLNWYSNSETRESIHSRRVAPRVCNRLD